MPAEKPSWLPAFVPAAILLLLIGAFFLASRHPHIPAKQNVYSTEDWEVEIPAFGKPPVKVWISRDGLFVWNEDRPAALGQLPARIAAYKRKVQHRIGYAEVAAEELARFDEVTHVISELRKAGFPPVTIATKPKADPTDPSW